jgi:hypothetical protein
MQQRFKPRTGCRVGKHMGAHPAPIQGTIRRDEVVAESVAQRFNRRTTWCGQRMRNAVGIDQTGAMGDEQVGHGGFAAADASGQADDESH